jgi:uncharacterized protein YjcR
MADMTDFEKTLLEKVDKMNDAFTESLATLTDRLVSFENKTEKALTELSGKMKGNHDLLKSDIQKYVQKDTCETHRELSGKRIKYVEDRVLILEGKVEDLTEHEKSRQSNLSERITAWMPSIIITLSIVGGIIWMAVK